MTGLVAGDTRRVVLNLRNDGAIEDLEPEDVVEVPCEVDSSGARPVRTGRLPDSVRGLVQAVKAYERTTIRAAVAGSAALAQLAMLEYPIIGQWELAGDLCRSLIREDPELLGYLR
jgi:6-phospho-beta-glucosidase